MSPAGLDALKVLVLVLVGATLCVVGALTGHGGDLNPVGTTVIGGALGLAIQKGGQSAPPPGGKP